MSYGAIDVVTNLIGSGNLYLVGSITATGFLFGARPSTVIDPRIAGGGCALTTQQYFAVDGTWKTRLTRLGGCPAR